MGFCRFGNLHLKAWLAKTLIQHVCKRRTIEWRNERKTKAENTEDETQPENNSKPSSLALTINAHYSIPIILLTNKSNFLILNNPSNLHTISSFVPLTTIAGLLSARADKLGRSAAHDRVLHASGSVTMGTKGARGTLSVYLLDKPASERCERQEGKTHNIHVNPNGTSISTTHPSSSTLFANVLKPFDGEVT